MGVSSVVNHWQTSVEFSREYPLTSALSACLGASMRKGNNLYQRERVLLCAPFGRDGLLIQKHLSSAGLIAQVCRSAHELSAAIGEGAGAALIGDEALSADSVEYLRAELARQAPWSDFPVIIMTSGG